jgi:hypothetical protein
MFQHAAKLFAIVIILSSCNQGNDSTKIATIVQGLHNANSLIQDYNIRMHIGFEQKSTDPMFSSWIQKWYLKTKKIEKLSSLMNSYIDSCINAMKAGAKTEIPTHTIYLKLFNYKRALVNVFDPGEYRDSPVYREHIIQKRKYLFAEIPVLASVDDTSTAAIKDLNEKHWLDSTFSNADTSMQTLMLYKIKNDILISEQIMLDFCFRSVTDHRPHYEEIRLITSLSSSNIKAGEPLEVTAGIAIVNNQFRPRITIGGKEVKLSRIGITEYTFLPRGKPGKYTLPVTIEITKADGTIENYQRKLNYTILP